MFLKLKFTENDLKISTEKLKKEQDILEEVTKNLTLNNQEKNFIDYLNNVNQKLDTIYPLIYYYVMYYICCLNKNILYFDT